MNLLDGQGWERDSRQGKWHIMGLKRNSRRSNFTECGGE